MLKVDAWVQPRTARAQSLKISVCLFVLVDRQACKNLQRLIHEELEMKKVCARWVARPLAGKRRQNCFDLCAMKLYYVN